MFYSDRKEIELFEAYSRYGCQHAAFSSAAFSKHLLLPVPLQVQKTFAIFCSDHCIAS